MSATSMSRMVLLAFVGACGISLAFAIQHFRREPPVDTKTALAAPAVSRPAFDARDQDPAALAAAQAKANAVASALAGSPMPPDSGEGVPAFDIARIGPTGEAVIAGRATPGAIVELLRNGELHDRAVADQSGQFVMVPPRFPAGTYDLTLRSKQPDGKQATSKQSVAVAIEPGPADRPVVALMTPGKPTVVLSQPSAPKPMAGAVVVESVETEPGGKFHASGRTQQPSWRPPWRPLCQAEARPPPWSCRRSQPPPSPAAIASGASAASGMVWAPAMPSFTRPTGSRSAIRI